MTLSDNRITVRFEDSLLNEIEKRREELFMTRQEFVRYAVQTTLKKLSKEDKALIEENIRLNARIQELMASNRSMEDFLDNF